MSLHLSRCTLTDVPAFAEAVLTTFEHMPRHIVTFGSMPRQRQLELCTADFKRGIESQDHPTPTKEVHYLKVTDTATDELIAYAIWIHLPTGYKVEEDSFVNVKEVPEGANEVFMRQFLRRTGELRGEGERRVVGHWHAEEEKDLYLPETPLMTHLTPSDLVLVGTHPSHERRGAATMLIQWGFEQADRDRKPCYVEGSSIGYNLYRRMGFTDVGELSVNLDDYEGGKGFGVHRWVAMVRQPGGGEMK